MARTVDSIELQLVAAALTGILAAQRKPPDMKLVCREAIRAGFRTALALRQDGRRDQFVRQPTAARKRAKA